MPVRHDRRSPGKNAGCRRPGLVTNEPLDLERVMTLVTDALTDVMLGIDPWEGARQLLERRRPTLQELGAARRENFEVHGGGMPEILKRVGFVAEPVPPEVLQMRRAIDDELHAATTFLCSDATS